MRLIPKFISSLRFKLVLMFILLAMFCVGLSQVCGYFLDERDALDFLRGRIIDRARSAATHINAQDLDAIRTPADKEKPEYKKVQQLLDEIKKDSKIIYNIYTFRRGENGNPVFVVDALPHEGEESAEVGEFVEDDKGVWRALINAKDKKALPHADNFISNDRFGSWLSGFAPIFHPNGEVAAYVGMDIESKTVTASKMKLLRNGFLGFLAVLPVAILLGLLFGNRMSSNLIKITRDMDKIGAMDFDSISIAPTNAEMAELATAFESMKAKLKNSIAKLEEANDAVEENRSLLRQLMDAMPYPVFCKDREGRYLECNEEFCKSFAKMEKKSIIGAKIKDFMPFLNPTLHTSMDELILSGKKTYIAYDSTIKADGSSRFFIVYKAALRDRAGASEGIVGTIIDITERKRMEDALRLEKTKADEANFAKSRFLANISHEIRTPLNGMIGAVELLREGAKDTRQLEMLDTMEESGRMLMAIICDILDLAKIEAGKMLLEEIPCNLNDILIGMDKVFKASAKKKGITPKLTLLPEEVSWVYCDPTRLRQLLANLLSNALKFTSQGFIELKAELLPARQTDNGPFYYRFSVQDTGIGIDPEKHSDIFETFTQEDISTVRYYGGYGLGLSICKHLVLLMGGKINVESEKGLGSTFYFDIPLKDAKANLEEAGDLTILGKTEAQGVKVLVADDHAPSVKITKGIVESFGCTCAEAYSFKDTLELTEERKFDVILLDLAMQDGFAYDAVPKIREQEKLSRRRPSFIVALTANSFSDNKTRCIKAGIDEFILKPVTKTLLSDVIRKALEFTKSQANA